MNAPAHTIGLGQIPVLLRGEPEAINEWIERWNAKRVLLYVAVIVIGAALLAACGSSSKTKNAPSRTLAERAAHTAPRTFSLGIEYP